MPREYYKLTDDAIEKLVSVTKTKEFVLVSKPGAVFDLRETKPDDTEEMKVKASRDCMRWGDTYVNLMKGPRILFHVQVD